MVELRLAYPAPAPDALRRVIGLRYVVAALLALAVLTIRFIVGSPVPWMLVSAVLLALLAVNVVVHWRVFADQTVSEKQLFANFVVEVLALTGVLYFLGGSTSPLASLYLLPVTVAANLLTLRHTWLVTLLTALCYLLLLVLNTPLDPHLHDSEPHVMQSTQHIVGHGVIFIVSAALVAHYVSSLAQSLRDRDGQLAHAREEALRNERIVALGTLSAGAAHELGTPLATMSVLAEDMGRRHHSHAELASDVADLQTEIAHCKRILNALTQATGSTRGGGGGAESADRFLERTVERWRLLRPAARVSVKWDDDTPGPLLLADQTLEQAVLNLLNNAADASPDGFEVSGRIHNGHVVIDILDRGPGLTEEAQARAGELFFSTKGSEGGMGIGLFLANATIERFGGSVRLFNRSDGGCCTRIELPSLADAGRSGDAR